MILTGVGSLGSPPPTISPLLWGHLVLQGPEQQFSSPQQLQGIFLKMTCSNLLRLLPPAPIPAPLGHPLHHGAGSSQCLPAWLGLCSEHDRRLCLPTVSGSPAPPSGNFRAVSSANTCSSLLFSVGWPPCTHACHSLVTPAHCFLQRPCTLHRLENSYKGFCLFVFLAAYDRT